MPVPKTEVAVASTKKKTLLRWVLSCLLIAVLIAATVTYFIVSRAQAEEAYFRAWAAYENSLDEFETELERANQLVLQSEGSVDGDENPALAGSVLEISEAVGIWNDYKPKSKLDRGLSASAYNKARKALEEFDGVSWLREISDQVEPELKQAKSEAFKEYSAPLATAVHDVGWYILSEPFERVGTDELVRLRNEEMNSMLSAETASEEEVLELLNKFYAEVERIQSEPDFSTQPEDIVSRWEAQRGNDDMEFRGWKANSSVGVLYPNESPVGPRSIRVDTSENLGKSCVKFDYDLVYCPAFATTPDYAPSGFQGSNGYYEASEVIKLDRFMDVATGEVWLRRAF